MAIKFSIVPEGLRELLSKFARWRGRRTTRRALTEAAEAIQAQVESGFPAQRDPWGKRWKRLKHRDGQALLKHGGLSGSFSTSVHGDHAEVGTNLIRAWTHQFGWRARNIPARPFLPIRSRSGNKPSERVGNVDIPVKWQEAALAAVQEAIRDR